MKIIFKIVGDGKIFTIIEVPEWRDIVSKIVTQIADEILGVIEPQTIILEFEDDEKENKEE